MDDLLAHENQDLPTLEEPDCDLDEESLNSRYLAYFDSEEREADGHGYEYDESICRSDQFECLEPEETSLNFLQFVEEKRPEARKLEVGFSMFEERKMMDEGSYEHFQSKYRRRYRRSQRAQHLEDREDLLAFMAEIEEEPLPPSRPFFDSAIEEFEEIMAGDY